MHAASARMKALQATAMRVGSSLRKMGSFVAKIFAGVGGLAAFGAFKLLGKVFEDANQEIEEAYNRSRKLTAALMKNENIAKKGPIYAARQRDLLLQHNEALAKQGIISNDMLDGMVAQLELSKLAPAQAAKNMDVMADVLAAIKGTAATEEDSVAFAKAWGSALNGGPVKALKNFGITVGPKMAKAFKSMSIDQINRELLKLAKFAKGFNAKTLGDPGGQTKKLSEDLQEMSQRIGRQVLPARDRMSKAWRNLLPEVEPYLRKFKQLGVDMQMGVANYMKDTLLPNLRLFSKWLKSPAFTGAWERVKTAWSNAVDKIGKAFAKLLPAGKDFKQTLGDAAVKALEALAKALQWVADNADTVVPMIKRLGISFAVLTPLVWAFNIAAGLNPLTWIAVAVVGLGLLIYNWDAVSTAADAALTTMANQPPTPDPSWHNFLITLAKSFLDLRDNMKIVDQFFITMRDNFYDGIKQLVEIVGKLDVAIKDGLGSAIEWVTGLWTKFTGFLSGWKMPSWLGGAAAQAAGTAYGEGVSSGQISGNITPATAGMAYRGAGAGSDWGGAAGATDATLIAERARLIEELKDPAVAQKVYQRVEQEVGSQGPRAQQLVMESFFNRAASRNMSLKDTVMQASYFPRGSTARLGSVNVGANRIEEYKGMLDQIAAGSTLAGYGTGNESGGVRSGGARVTAGSRGERIVEELGDAKWIATRKQIAREAAAAAATAATTQVAQNEPPPLLKALQHGGVVTKPTLAAIGEKGPEAVIPLGRKGGGGDTAVHFNPIIHINGNASQADQEAMDTKLRDLARDFVAQFKRAQSHERRLSYEGGYG